MHDLPNPRAVLASTYVRLGRFRAALSVVELAELAGVSPDTVRRIEKGDRLSKKETVIQVLAALDPEDNQIEDHPLAGFEDYMRQEPD